jgi:hypothetical protein
MCSQRDASASCAQSFATTKGCKEANLSLLRTKGKSKKDFKAHFTEEIKNQLKRVGFYQNITIGF